MRLAAIITLVLLLFVVACGTQNNEPKANSDSALVENSKGLELMQQNCYACHNPKAESHDDLLAPPFVAIKRRYSKEYNSQNDFVAAVVNYATSPDSNKALMRGAIHEFGLMTPMPIGEEKLAEIATYLYQNNPEEPAWFQQHFEEMHGKGKGRNRAK